jgi:O-antigen/teichoic acid export membrane protein
LLALLAPPSYQVAAPAVPLLVGALAFAAMGNILGNTLVASGDSRTPLLINLWTSGLSIVLNIVFIRLWGLMGAAWASFAYSVLGWALVDVVVSRRLRPEGRGYVGILVVLAGVFLVGMNATLALRVLLIIAGTLGSLVLSPPLRRDVYAVWRSRRHGKPS